MDFVRWVLDRVDILAVGAAVFLLCRRADRVTAAWTQILTSYQRVVDSLTTTSQRSLEIDAAVKQGQAQLTTELCKVVSRDYLQAGLQFATINNPQIQPLPQQEKPIPPDVQELLNMQGPEDQTGFITGVPQAYPLPPSSPDARTHIPGQEM